jgi:ABC-type bacteriocin/lantibiotic exporter with double-glycine peptidase domain
LYNIIHKTISIIRETGVSNLQIFRVALFSIISFVFEIFGIGIFIPIISFVQDPNKDVFIIDNILNTTNGTVDVYIVIFIFVLIIFILKSFAFILYNYYLVSFWSDANIKLTDRLFKITLNTNYVKFINKSNSSHLSIIITEVEQFCELIKFSITFIVEFFILISIFLILLYFNPAASSIVFLMLILTFAIISIFFRKRLILWGKKRQEYQDELQNNINGGLINYLSISINNTLSFFSENVFKSISNRNRFIKRQFVYESIPRGFIEVSAILMLSITFLILKYILNISVSEILSFQAFLLISFSRILPSLNRILTSYNFINFSKSVVNKIGYIIDAHVEISKNNTIDNFEKNIEISDLAYKYEGIETPLITDFSDKILKGSIVGIFGKSGSGKSTLIKIIMGFLDPYKGKITIDKINYDNINKRSLRDLFGYVEQNVRIFNASLIQNITFKNMVNDEELSWFKKVINFCQLDNIINYNTNNGSLIEDGLNLSGGQVQRIGLARALFKRPQILVLDEFTSSLDIENRNKLSSIIEKINKEEGITIVIVSHDIFFKSMCDKIIQLNNE